MSEEKFALLDGIDSYLPHVDGVINCMHNYCLNGCKSIDVTAAAPGYKNYKDDQPYKIIRCKSKYFPILNIQYACPARDKKFYKEAAAKKYDIVHVHSPFGMSKFMLKIAKEQNIPAVATFHTNLRPIVRQMCKSKLLAEIAVKIISRVYNKYDEVFVCSPPVAEQCRSFGYKGKFSYLPYGTDLPRCENKSGLRAKADEKFGFSEDELVFIYVGRIEKLKRISFILDSLKILKERGKKFRFFAVGTGSDLKKMERRSKKLGFTDREVCFTGFVERDILPLLYARADLFLFPSLYDNFGLVKVEAAAYSTPGVFIDGSCTGYGVTHGVNGYLSKDTCKDFADVIEGAVSDRKALAEAGVRASQDLYITWEECTERYIERLKEIAKEHKNRASGGN